MITFDLAYLTPAICKTQWGLGQLTCGTLPNAGHLHTPSQHWPNHKQITTLAAGVPGRAQHLGDNRNHLIALAAGQRHNAPKQIRGGSMASDLLSGSGKPEKNTYDASSIQVLEDMEHVRLRPGMYIGGKDDRALHHMVAEIVDNSMDEAVAGHATWIEIELHENGHVTVRDNGRGIPTDPHPKDPSKTALEIIFCTLNAGGKFSGDSYETSGGLHGVGSSVVNALSDHLRVEVARNKELMMMEFSRGVPQAPLAKIGPDAEIFGSLKLKPARLFKMARSKAYLFSGVEIRWKTGIDDGETPQEAMFKFPGGLADYLNETLAGATAYAHEAGFWAAILKGIKAYGELVNNRKASTITRDDLTTGAGALVSCFIREPEFVGQTKDRLATTEAQRMVENAVRANPRPRNSACPAS